MGVKCLSFTLVVLSSIFIISANGEEAECSYRIEVETGTLSAAGTDSKISLTIFDSSGAGLEIPNLEDWGQMEPGHDYFENGDLDIFAGKGPCLSGPVCGLQLISDGEGSKAGWFCQYVKVSSCPSGKPCSEKDFIVEQWLAVDEPPYDLTAKVNDCYRARIGLLPRPNFY